MANEGNYTYIFFVLTLIIFIVEVYSLRKNKKLGHGYAIHPFRMIAEVIVILMALYGIITGQTIDDVRSQIENLLQ